MRITSLYRGAREFDPGIRVEDVIAVILLGGNEPLGFAGLCKCIACVRILSGSAYAVGASRTSLQISLCSGALHGRNQSNETSKNSSKRELQSTLRARTSKRVCARGVALRISLATHLLNCHSGLYVDDSPGLRRPAVHQPAYTSARTHHVN
jgi:hypothetical protein